MRRHITHISESERQRLQESVERQSKENIRLMVTAVVGFVAVVLSGGTAAVAAGAGTYVVLKIALR